MHSTLSIAAQHLNEYPLAAERVPSITHTPSFDSDALYYAERTIQSISGQCSGGRSFAYTNTFAEDCSTHQSNRDDGDADLVDAGSCRFLLSGGYSFTLEIAVQKPHQKVHTTTLERTVDLNQSEPVL